jgi:hypothetical protein
MPTNEKNLPIDTGNATLYKARSMITKNIPPPPRKTVIKRITPELREMVPGDSVLFPDRLAAVAFVSWARQVKRWKTATKKEAGGVRAWRVE